MRMVFKHTLMALGLAAAGVLSLSASAKDLGIEGKIYEVIEEDFRITLMRLVASADLDRAKDDMRESAEQYTANLPNYFVMPATETKTVWKDVGIILTEDIYLPWVDRETGSVFEPEQVKVAEKGSYFNPIAKLPSNAIERLFVFDATDPEQLALARALMVQDVPNLYFMLVAGDLGPLSKEMNRPIYHPAPTMLEKFHITSVPTLVGFGKGQHQGHMAVTSFNMPVTLDTVKSAWFGLPYPGYAPDSLIDVIPVEKSSLKMLSEVDFTGASTTAPD